MGQLYKAAQRVSRIGASDLSAGLLWVVVFGPGHGEAILVRLPTGEVGIVDGCREPEKDCPMTKLLGELNPQRLLFACLTHPHEDHYKGLGRLIGARRKTVDHVWHVLGLTANEQKAVVEYAKDMCRPPKGKKRRAMPDAGSWEGMERAFREIMAAAKEGARRRQLLAERPLLNLPVSGLPPFEIDAWGPSDEDVTDALVKFVGRIGRRAKRDDLPNQVSGALLLRWGKSRVLLAGDLYAQKHHHQGWGPARLAAVRESPVQVVNVAHHASENAHDDALWKAMKPELAIVTPFRSAGLSKKGQKPFQPPKPADIVALLKSNSEVVITSEPRWLGKPLKPPPPSRRAAGATPRTASTLPGTSPLLAASPPPDTADTRNAAAVGLDSNGKIVKVVLGGDADFYV